jgi:D-beta-D-heptose 7-phosphate kinase/D-beta-D-heptose 1-phosphate adenosyltransferase
MQYKKMKKVLVIGDGCKDVFQYGKCERLSPEAPIPVFKPLQAKSNGGMAVNVYNNLIALGIDCDIITDSGTTKTRFVDEISNQMLLRVDEKDEIESITENRLMSIDFTQYDAVVISDYGKGFLSIKDIEYIAYNHKLVFMDTKKTLDMWCLNVDVIKINEKEFNRNKDFCEEYSNMLVVTLGSRGAMFNSEIFPIEEEHPVRDLSGAGDTFLAALVADYVKNHDIRSAIKFANKCSAWVVTQKGVAVVDLEKIK